MKSNKLKTVLGAACSVTAMAMCLASCSQLARDALVYPSEWSRGEKTTDYYLMSYIGANKYITSDSLHLSYSDDGLTWTELNGGGATFTSSIGSRHFRDPYIFRMNNGKFVLLASDFTQAGRYLDMGSRSNLNYWEHPSSNIVVAYSDDLVSWYDEHLLALTQGRGTNGGTRHVWAPKAVYNSESLCYDIYWTGDDENGVNHTYVTQTCDFYSVKSLDDHCVYSPGFSVLWSTAVQADDGWYLFARNGDIDYASARGGDIQAAYLKKWRAGEFNLISEHYVNRTNQLAPVSTEYPCVYRLEDNSAWLMLLNRENNPATFDAFATSDISDPESWISVEDAGFNLTGLPSGCSANIVRITADELAVLLAAGF